MWVDITPIRRSRALDDAGSNTILRWMAPRLRDNLWGHLEWSSGDLHLHTPLPFLHHREARLTFIPLCATGHRGSFKMTTSSPLLLGACSRRCVIASFGPWSDITWLSDLMSTHAPRPVFLERVLTPHGRLVSWPHHFQSSLNPRYYTKKEYLARATKFYCFVCNVISWT